MEPLMRNSQASLVPIQPLIRMYQACGVIVIPQNLTGHNTQDHTIH